MRIILALALAVGLSNRGVSGAPPVKIVTLGDSITRGVRGGVKAEDTFAYQLQQSLAKENLKTNVVNVGIGGERTDQALNRLGSILKLRPSIVTIMYGTNDSYVDRGAKDARISPEAFRKNLEKLIADLRKAGVTPILMTEPRWGDKAGKNGVGEHPNLRLERYVKVCREVAVKTKTPLVDHFAHWTAANSKGTDIGTWTTDQCHPNPRGHAEITKLMLPTVRGALRK
ncbi:MAG: SGNH/GDSL hydrolase family protein [Planctomycetes bacterium]|nr:SGNH/GDSL hydrolase family protein [Planctomycetota bacterium]